MTRNSPIESASDVSSFVEHRHASNQNQRTRHANGESEFHAKLHKPPLNIYPERNLNLRLQSHDDHGIVCNRRVVPAGPRMDSPLVLLSLRITVNSSKCLSRAPARTIERRCPWTSTGCTIGLRLAVAKPIFFANPDLVAPPFNPKAAVQQNVARTMVVLATFMLGVGVSATVVQRETIGMALWTWRLTRTGTDGC